MKKFSKLHRLSRLLKYMIHGEGDIFIGDLPRMGKPTSRKMNMYGGWNTTYKALPGQYCTAITKELGMEEQEITHFSIHEKIPLYRVDFTRSKSVFTSPLNAILVCKNDTWELADLRDQGLVGCKTPAIDSFENVFMDTIAHIEDFRKSVTMYDISMDKHRTFLTEEGVFLYDTAAIHFPVTPEAIKDAQKLLPSVNLRWEATGDLLTGPKHAASSGLYMLSKSKEGQKEINSLLPKKYHISKQSDSKAISNLLLKIDKDKENNTADIMTKLRDLGEDYTFRTGFTVGVKDMTPLKKIREETMVELKKEIASIPKNKDYQDKLLGVYVKYSNKLTDKLSANYKKDFKNPLGVMLNAKARGNPSQFRDLVLTPLATLGGELTKDPIEHSYMEGLNPWEFWQTSYGARKGNIGRAQDTALPGALSQELLTTANQIVIGDIETPYMKDRTLSTEKTKDILDRIVSKDIKNKEGRVIIKKGEVVSARVLQDASKHNIKELPVYTPLGSSNIDGSLPAMAYGLSKDGNLLEIGDAVGVMSAHGIVEPLFSSSMSSFHTGGSLQDVESGYPRLKQLLELPKSLPRQATLSKLSGTVTKITKDDLGGHSIMVNDVSHYSAPNVHLKVSAKDTIEKGDPLTSGAIHPAELADLQGLHAAQNYLLAELHKEVPKVKSATLEVIVEALTRYGEITDPGDSKYHHGDIILLNKIKEANDDLENPIIYKYVFKGVNTLPQAVQGPISKLNFRNLKREFKKSVIFGEEEDIHSYSPIVSIMKGETFGQGEKGKY